ncbi:hypothetical protein L198_05607 [Cryptococcus wingfieldii CBS 7118]|uniref:Uncharacterized protein n=1 Tax=Cryptococcus wingfieldii CBS 7118 TaxID=1295528 RepID=A0A1E3IYN1_9TREE|nr:hypothetical protein L198_05607 [Cryptococcus wingfieldii CBS 7118]ODN92811.1 hypothetical protein L198_05607 [Cryptococcus wingfieldii CBS 7118]
MPAPSVSTLEATSAILGEYMLKGWTLTDLHCSSCKTTPLMREPAAIASRENRERVQFCAGCDGRPEGRVRVPPVASVPEASVPAGGLGAYETRAVASESTDRQETVAVPQQSRSRPAEASQQSQSQTEPKADPAASLSQLLLQGYSLLADTCPNTSCRGIPLAGYPKRKDGSKDGRKVCVSCGMGWVEEKSVDEGWVLTGEKKGTREDDGGAESPRSKKRRELYGLGDVKGKGKAVDVGEFERQARASENELVSKAEEKELEEAVAEVGSEGSLVHKDILTKEQSSNSIQQPHLAQSLTQTSSALSTTLSHLASSLSSLTQPERLAEGEKSGKLFVDIKLHTEALKDVLGVLGEVEKARKGW